MKWAKYFNIFSYFGQWVRMCWMTEWKQVTGLPERKSSWRPVWVARPGPGLPRPLWLSLSSASWGHEASSCHTLAQLTRLPFRISCGQGDGD